jgi:hypothetical protein
MRNLDDVVYTFRSELTVLGILNNLQYPNIEHVTLHVVKRMFNIYICHCNTFGDLSRLNDLREIPESSLITNIQTMQQLQILGTIYSKSIHVNLATLQSLK